MLRVAGVAAALALKQSAAASAAPALGALFPIASRLHGFELFGTTKVTKVYSSAAAPALAVPTEYDIQVRTGSSAHSPAGFKDSSSYMLMHPVYSTEYLDTVRPTHRVPEKVHEKIGYHAVQTARKLFDLCTGYGSEMNERKWLQRMIYLESVAGVPGMVGGALRHLRSLRTLRRDHGWIHTLLEEAENERMHLLTFLKLRQPGIAFRAMVLMGQGFFFNVYLLSYLISPRTCHSFVGYLEEEAVKTYTRAIQDLDAGKLPQWSATPAPEIAVKYWRLAPGATMRDLLLAVRADEACHMYVNHTFSTLDVDATNPFQPGSVHVH